MLDTKPALLQTDFPPIRRHTVQTLQVNLGYLCNLSCTHCHVNAGPKRTELMDRETIDEVLSYIDQKSISTLDLTGGAPEMNPHFRYLVAEASKRGVAVTDRCNLTILLEPGYEDMADFLARHRVIITASLPCYSEQNVAEQRGKGVFEASVEALQHLNKLGYGRDEALPLNLAYNPNGAFLPPEQGQLEADYKKALKKNYGIDFHSLLTITNMPISRFGSMLLSKGLYDDYMNLLKTNFSQQNLEAVMCKTLLSIDWRGYVYDCDFNQMLDLPLRYQQDIDDKKIASDKKRWHLRDLLESELTNAEILVGEHCYGCTAGQGSSCGGALAG
ncbi:MAG: radical SAM/Cys-rich protein [Cellvibrionaceae bacterium]|jgi:radical SAM/Cys-rich protein